MRVLRHPKAARRSGGLLTVYREHDRIVKRRKSTALCVSSWGPSWGRPGLALPAQAESLGQELAAMAQALLVDAVADARRHVPFHRHFQRGQVLRALEQRLWRDQLVLVAMHQQHRRPGL